MARTYVAAATSGNGAASQHRRRALIVDHEPVVREFLRAVLVNLGWTVSEASGDGLRPVDFDEPELLIVDPDTESGTMAAWEDRLRRQPRLRVLVISMHPHAADFARAIGARSLPKPCDIRELAATIEACFASDSIGQVAPGMDGE